MVRLPQQSTFCNVVVTGASAGIGRAVALRFARAGARLGLMARAGDALLDVKDEVECLGARAVIAPVDVSDADAVFAAAAAIVAELGPIDIWINDAMVTVFSPVWEMTPDEFRRVTDVTYLGAVHGTMAALRHMRPRNRGTILQVGSALAYRGIPLQAAYCGAKHALRGFTDSLRSELIHDRSAIALTMVELPAVNTPQFDWARTHMPRKPRPVPPVVQPEAIAEQIFHAALHPKREYWLGISTLEAIWGNMVLPEFLDRYLARKAVAAQQTSVLVAPGREDNLTAPVHGLHRTRGSFGAHAASRVVAVPGPVARLAPLLFAALAGLAAGLALRSAAAARLTPQPQRRAFR
jgi:NAD(P)-dependent dehydrogenase (short-subunit alcohol dehydrogenase family)